jgi:hypothetical protein
VDIAFAHQPRKMLVAYMNVVVDEIGLNARASVRLTRRIPMRFRYDRPTGG